MTPEELWSRYKRYACVDSDLGLQIDVSRMSFDDVFLTSMAEPMARAFDAMKELEGGAEANIDEHRMVGHYWLRAPELAPNDDVRAEIEQAITAIRKFSDSIHTGQLTPQRADGFYLVLVVGIGGSTLGPQLICDALGQIDDPILVRFIDNTDPDGFDRLLAELDETLQQTLTVVISKSGGTKETRNAMLEVAAAYQRNGLDFAKHAVAVTQEGSTLHRQAVEQQWLQTFPMWDWVGGRTSVLSAVGLLPAALKAWTSTPCLRGRGTATRSRAGPTLFTTPPHSWPLCGITPARGAAPGTWSCCPIRTDWRFSAVTSSS